MTPDQTAALLRRILDHPRVKAYGEGWGWYQTTCKGRLLSEAPTPWAPIPTGLAYTGPDLAADSNLHELLGLADAIACMGVDVDYDPTDNRYFVLMHGPDYQTIGDGHGPTRTLAVIAALGRALNIGDTE